VRGTHHDTCCAVPCCPAVGLVSSLVQHGVLTRPSQLAGSSAGSLIAASFNSGEAQHNTTHLLQLI
jgi:hypothetical protein